MKNPGLMMALLATASPVMAQSPLAVPDAGHIFTPPQKSPALRPSAVPQPAPAEMPLAMLRFSDVTVGGAHVVASAAIAAEFAGLRDHDVTAADLKAALDRVNALYRHAGFPLGRAMIPAQRIADGTLVVTVTEGFVSQVVVTSNDAATKKLVERAAARVTRERPLTEAALERAILLIQDMPGVTLTSRFGTSDPVTGATVLVLDAQLKRATLGLNLDNRAGFGQLPLQPYLTATLNNALGWGDRIALTALLSPRQNDYAYYGVSLSRAVGDDGLRIGLDGSWAQALDDVSIRPYQVRSRSTQIAAGARTPLLLTTDETLAVQGRVYDTNAHYNLASGLTGAQSGVIAHDGIVATELGADYARAFSPDLGIGGSVKLNQGLASTTGEPHTRLNTIPAFTRLRGEAKLVWKVAGPVTFKIGALAQASMDSLAASEEIAFGGLAYGHGFQPAEISGDKGVGASFQPEYRIAVQGDWSVTPFLLGDYAKVWNRHGDRQGAGELVSAGGGMRLGLARYGDITLEMDKPLNKPPLGHSDKDWRFYAGLQLGADEIVSLIAGNR